MVPARTSCISKQMDHGFHNECKFDGNENYIIRLCRHKDIVSLDGFSEEDPMDVGRMKFE